jgi:uncharacterized surface protein with fasciclin (FAS1) repeats
MGQQSSQQGSASDRQATPQAQQQQRTAQSSAQERSTQQAQQSAAQRSSQAAGSGDLGDLASEHRELSTFVEALQAAGLEQSLTSGTQYTVFAPTNEAFEEMREDKDDLLSADNREELTDLLRSHIVADDVDPSRAQQLREARTLDGGTVELSSEDGKMMVGDANIVASSIEHGNLRIYAIDQVLDSRGDRNNSAGDQAADRSRADDDSRTRSGAALGDDERSDSSERSGAGSSRSGASSGAGAGRPQ